MKCTRWVAWIGTMAVIGLTQVPMAAGGEFTVSYGATKNPRWTALQTQFKKTHFLERIAGQLNSKVALPKDIPISLTECGQANAFYNPGAGTIQLCYEIVDQFSTLFAPYLLSAQDREPYVSGMQSFEFANEDMVCKKDHLFDINQHCYRDEGVYPSSWHKRISRANAEKAEGQIRDTLVFILYHEAGHAYSHLLKLPITGREEDAVDQLAAHLSIADTKNGGAASAVNAAVAFTRFQPGFLDILFKKWPFADEHSLGKQRFFNILCWVYGSDSKRWASLVADGHLPAERAVRCPGEYAQLSSSWEVLLKSYQSTTPSTPGDMISIKEIVPIPTAVLALQSSEQAGTKKLVEAATQEEPIYHPASAFDDEDPAITAAKKPLTAEERRRIENQYPNEGTLGSIRSALSIYYGDHNNTYPASIDELAVDNKYLRGVPGKKYLIYDAKKGDVSAKPR